VEPLASHLGRPFGVAGDYCSPPFSPARNKGSASRRTCLLDGRDFAVCGARIVSLSVTLAFRQLARIR
jgi:hypothetical protein